MQCKMQRMEVGRRTRGAGPRTTLPWELYCEPWHGHLNLLSVELHGTTQPEASDISAVMLRSPEEKAEVLT